MGSQKAEGLSPGWPFQAPLPAEILKRSPQGNRSGCGGGAPQCGPGDPGPGVGAWAKVTPSGRLVKAQPPPPWQPPWERRPSRSGGECWGGGWVGRRKRKLGDQATRAGKLGGAPPPSPRVSREHRQPQALALGWEGPARVLPVSQSSSPGPASQTALALRPATANREAALSVRLGQRARAPGQGSRLPAGPPWQGVCWEASSQGRGLPACARASGALCPSHLP